MTLLSPDQSVFVLIDVQGKLVRLVHEPDRLLESCHRFLQLAELFQRPVVMTEQYPKGLGGTEESLAEAFEQLSVAKRRVEKDSFGCCGETTFDQSVGDLLPNVSTERRQYVLAGMETHICVLQTALGLLDTGASVFVAWDCVSGRGSEYTRWGLERMQQAGVVISNHESVGFELAQDKNHRSFKGLSTLLKNGQPVQPRR